MTDVAAPPPATGRACPRCGAALAPDQEWCLNCGTAVGTRIAPTPRWRGPVLLVGALLTLLGVALVLALVELSSDPQPVAKAPTAQPTPAPVTPPDDGTPEAPVAGETPTPAPAGTPGATPEPAPAATGELAEWPAGETAWTVVLASTEDRAEAEEKARAAGGTDVGVLRSDDFSSLRKGYWVVFRGQYDTRDAAEDAVEDAAGDAYARRVVPR